MASRSSPLRTPPSRSRSHHPFPRRILQFCRLHVFLVFLLSSIPLSKSLNAAKLTSLRSNSTNGIIRVRDGQLIKLIKASSPRPFFTVLYFRSLTHETSNPSMELDKRLSELVLVSKKFLELEKANHELSPSAFFLEIELAESPRAFEAYEVQQLPCILIFPPVSSKQIKPPPPKQLNPYPISAQGLADAIEKATGIHFGEVKEPPLLSTTQKWILSILFLVSLPILVTGVARLLQKPWAWCVAAIAIYTLSVAGTMFNVINPMPWYEYSEEDPHRRVYWYEDDETQYQGEGIMAGLLYAGAGLLFSVFSMLAPAMKRGILQRGLVIASISGFGYLAWCTVTVVNSKSGYMVAMYYPHWFPPLKWL